MRVQTVVSVRARFAQDISICRSCIAFGSFIAACSQWDARCKCFLGVLTDWDTRKIQYDHGTFIVLDAISWRSVGPLLVEIARKMHSGSVFAGEVSAKEYRTGNHTTRKPGDQRVKSRLIER